MHVLLIEPYYGGSHRAWADGYQRHSRHDVSLLTLPAQFWKWRMQGGAVTMARLLRERNLQPDVILVSDMIDLAAFRALTRHLHAPVALYFHETQLTYPQNARQNHGWRYAFTNYISALAADAVFFNSPYHHDIFFKTLPNMLKHFGDYNELDSIESIRAKAAVLPLGLDLRRYDAYSDTATTPTGKPPLLLWNHRWEEDKNPALFLRVLDALLTEGFDFRVAITGENFRQDVGDFEAVRARLGARVVQFGYLPDFASYARLLWQANYVISTAHQEFFGGAVAEAIYCGCIPLLPHRLNYPHLIPPDAHKACLYPDQTLLSLIRHHLNGAYPPDGDRDGLRAVLQAHITSFDWSSMAARYDAALESLR